MIKLMMAEFHSQTPDPGIVHAGSLSHYCNLLRRLSRMKTLLILLVTSVQFKISAVNNFFCQSEKTVLSLHGETSYRHLVESNFFFHYHNINIKVLLISC